MLQINKSLKLLEVSENGVCMHLASVFCSIIVGLQHNNTLVNMSLSVDSITAADQDTVRSLTKMLQVNKSLTCLHLSLNFESGARCIYEGLQHNTSLVNLSIHNNSITATDPDTVISLTKMLQENNVLTHLDLSQNGLSDSGARCIFEGLQHNTTLVSLSLHDNNITAVTARSLTKMLQINKSLTHLDLSYNQFDDQMILCIFQGLEHNTTLLHLNLYSTGITDRNAEYIGQALKSNCTLQSLDIAHNSSLGDKGNFSILDSLMFNEFCQNLQISLEMLQKC